MAIRTREGFLAELADAGKKLIDFIEQVNAGRQEYYKEIATKLRLIYVDVSGKPLLKRVSKMFGFEVVVLDKPPLSDLNLPGAVFMMDNHVMTWLEFEKGDKVIPIFDAFCREAVDANGEKHTYTQIIKVAAEQMGGAHVDRNVDDRDLALHDNNLRLAGLPVAQRALLDIARVTLPIIEGAFNFATTGRAEHFIEPRVPFTKGYGRNDKCPCGSGKKVKLCCGKGLP
jgi:SEC-C motif-containing protein